MSNSSYIQFVDFVELDRRVRRLAKVREELLTAAKQYEQKRVELKQETEEAYKKVRETQKEIELCELELKSDAQKLQQRKLQLDSAKTPREYTGLEQEIKDIKKRGVELEEKGFELLTGLEQAQKQYENTKALEPAKMSVIEASITENQKQLTSNDELEKSLREQGEKQEKLLDKELLSQYKEMKAKVPDPVVPLIDGNCSACFYPVSPNDALKVKNGLLPPCKNCYRLLYTHQQGNNV